MDQKTTQQQTSKPLRNNWFVFFAARIASSQPTESLSLLCAVPPLLWLGFHRLGCLTGMYLLSCTVAMVIFLLCPVISYVLLSMCVCSRSALPRQCAKHFFHRLHQ